MLLLLLDLQTGTSSGGGSGTINTNPPPAGCVWGFATYAAFRQTLQALIDGDDYSVSTISPSILDLITAMGEKRVYRDVRSSSQEASLTGTVASNSLPLPSDLIELRSLYVPAGRTLKYMPYQQMEEKIQRQSAQWTTSVYYSFEGDNIVFYPILPDGTVVNGRYWKSFCSITTEGLTGNALFARYPELFLFAALNECGPYVGELQRMPEWEKRYDDLVTEINGMERKRILGGSKLQTRVA